MPGSVANAVATTVMPEAICSAFSHSREYALISNEYALGESQRDVLVSSSKKSWHLTRKLTASLLAELRGFYLARKGPTEAFYFYDPFEGTYDATGVSTTGRFTVHFVGGFTQVLGLPRAEVGFGLVELA